ncbi:MAG TPA: CHAT domain-containing protein, partial [Blastocatellia bacterium]|nr:CHAT domain-containing protein [Blastocatellia bacterium]
YAGAARVMSTLWRIDDRATAELMKRFYTHIFGPAHLPPPAALREAQLDLRRRTPWQSPYHWAGFVIQGEWR